MTRTPIRYLTIGAGCAVLNNAILIGADFSGLHYTAATALTFVTTVPLAYAAHALWTFNARLSWRGLARFVAGSLSSLMAAGLTIAALCGGLALPMVLAAPLATAVMVLYNFFMARWAVTPTRCPEG
ncbi:putative flippase GtrA [Blastomonas natatoria]|uniref:Putative flippase GtrA n=1 Tax=Blastomonas natatoria TaxID=34015 RepID=A0A2V3V8L6_9SPHN|nr:GtrA family protein [Blastomonas natatoria]PXW78172.1 putative flippase GtrA [Blastomonas natatoria]